jgi:hypothetical protein
MKHRYIGIIKSSYILTDLSLLFLLYLNETQ